VPNLTGEYSIELTVLNVSTSARWYADVLDLVIRRETRDEYGHLAHVVLGHASGLTLGLVEHEVSTASEFDERRVGLDHLEFIVPCVEDVHAWAERLDELGIHHSGVKDFDYAAGVMVTFRDPDNIQLEFYALKPATRS